MRHKHADLIHQIAEGALLQKQEVNGLFYPCPERILFSKHADDGIFRIQPGTENSGLPPGVFAWSGYEPPQPERTQLTVLEQFAKEAMKITFPECLTTEMAVKKAYEVADAMIKASGVSE